MGLKHPDMVSRPVALAMQPIQGFLHRANLSGELVPLLLDAFDVLHHLIGGTFRVRQRLAVVGPGSGAICLT